MITSSFRSTTYAGRRGLGAVLLVPVALASAALDALGALDALASQ